MPPPIIEEELVPEEILANLGDFREIEPEFRSVMGKTQPKSCLVYIAWDKQPCRYIKIKMNADKSPVLLDEIVVNPMLSQSVVTVIKEAATLKPMTIDTHVHFHHKKEKDLDRAIEWMDARKIQRVINHTLPQTRMKTDLEREQMLKNYAKYKDRIYRFCIIEPDDVKTVEQAVEILEKEKASGAIGFGEHYGRKLFFDDPKCMRLFAACEKVGMPVMFDISGVGRHANMDGPKFKRLRNALKAHPRLIFIAHSDWWRRGPEECGKVLREYPNLYADLSCSVRRSWVGRDKTAAKKFFIEHADKLLMASDSGWWSLGKNKPRVVQEIEFTKALDLPEDVYRKIFYRNAEKLFGFGEKKP